MTVFFSLSTDAMDNDYRTVVLPTIDKISSDTYRMKRRYQNEYARRGIFNWIFAYKLTPLLPSSVAQPAKPFESPIMAGGLFAISTRFFWEIGGYDEGLNTYGTFCICEWLSENEVLFQEAIVL